MTGTINPGCKRYLNAVKFMEVWRIRQGNKQTICDLTWQVMKEEELPGHLRMCHAYTNLYSVIK